MQTAATLEMDRVLRDGGSVHLRAIRPDDKQRLVDHFSHLSARSVYFRFFRVKKRLSDDELREFTELDFVRRVAVVATLRRDGAEEIIGVGRYAVMQTRPGEPRRAEVAFAVADAHQRRGIASLLLEVLAEIARAAGIEEFEADVLGENNSMLAVFGASGYRVTRALEDGVFHLSFPTQSTPESLVAEHRRERRAAAASVRAFLNPRAVAVVGASPRPDAFGSLLLAQVLAGGFAGAVYPVHPRAAELGGRRAHASVGAIGQPIDLALIAVPAAAVEAVVDDCARAGVRGVVIYSAGFAEHDAEGRARQQRVAAAVRAAGMRLVGPNGFGVINSDPAVRLNATIAPLRLTPGPVAMLSQSGAIGLAVLERCARRGLGLSSFVSVGNKADLSGNDLLAYWSEDERTRVVLLYLESFGNPRKFARVAPELARRVPIVAVKAGRSSDGARAAAGHSAAPAALDVAADALFAQAGVIRTDTLAEQLEVAALLATQPVPRGPRVGVVTNVGGPAVLFADAAAAGGLSFPLPPARSGAGAAALPPPPARGETDVLPPAPSSEGLGWGSALPPAPSGEGLGWGSALPPAPSGEGLGWGSALPPAPSGEGLGWGSVLPPPPSGGGLGWGIDLGFAARPTDYRDAIARLGAASELDAVAVIYATPLPADVDAFAAAIARGAAAVPAEKPVVVVFMAPGGRLPAALHEGGRGRLAAYDLPESAARALAAAARYGAWRAR
ncbi:MAG: GNAT family N-acetyltransferase, partial [Deltaproteobacteria bacterium]|nr:GNAT family N-acetyltransferase [Deltaproteobacteria bacterium]